MPRELTSEQRAIVMHEYNKGNGYKKISKATGFSISTIKKTIKRFQERGDLQSRQRSGRPVKLTTRDKRVLVRLTKKERFQSSTQLSKDLEESTGSRVTPGHLRKVLIKEGMRARRPRKKPFVNERQRQARLNWAKAHQHWTVEDWSKVIFSDESNFDLQNHSGLVTVRRSQGEAFRVECCLPTVKHPTTIMIWGCFSMRGPGRIKTCEGRMNGKKYIEILKREMLLTVRDQFGEGSREFIFQQDNAPCHTAAVVKEWFRKEGITVLDWPSQSPDINPIENLWIQIKRMVAAKKPKDKVKLTEAIIDSWHRVIRDEPERLRNLIESMPRRCKAVIAARGYPTKY